MTEYTFRDNLLEFAKQYVKEAGSLFDDVGIEKAWSPLKLLDLSKYTCVRCESADTGYEIFEYQEPEGEELVLMILDTVSGHWVKVE